MLIRRCGGSGRRWAGRAAGGRSYGLRYAHLDLGGREREGCTPLRSGPRGAHPDLLSGRLVRCGLELMKWLASNRTSSR